MKAKLKIVFGSNAVRKLYVNKKFTNEELEINIKEYEFDSKIEKRAFIRGIEETIGWNEYCIPELEIEG